MGRKPTIFPRAQVFQGDTPFFTIAAAPVDRSLGDVFLRTFDAYDDVIERLQREHMDKVSIAKEACILEALGKWASELLPFPLYRGSTLIGLTIEGRTDVIVPVRLVESQLTVGGEVVHSSLW